VKLFGEPSPKPGVDHEAENRRRKRELARVTKERDIQTKGEFVVRHWSRTMDERVLRARVPMKYDFIRAHREACGVRAMCRVLRLHFSGFYAWLKEPLSHRAQEDARQTKLIRHAWAESGEVYGLPQADERSARPGRTDPRHHRVHLCQELLPPRHLLLQCIAKTRNGRLLRHRRTSSRAFPQPNRSRHNREVLQTFPNTCLGQRILPNAVPCLRLR
jgi:putative transposase